MLATAVKRKHAEYVPDRLSEQEFWTSFFQSHYFHRDRINVNSKDLFAECAILDEHGNNFLLFVKMCIRLVENSEVMVSSNHS